MIISASDFGIPSVLDLRISDDTIQVDLADGRTVSAPLVWFPRLEHATRKERNQWRLIGRGTGIHWPLIDEDVSVEGLLAGRPSGESQASFKKWLEKRTPRPKKPRSDKK